MVSTFVVTEVVVLILFLIAEASRQMLIKAGKIKDTEKVKNKGTEN
jgi:hypothetical protein